MTSLDWIPIAMVFQELTYADLDDSRNARGESRPRMAEQTQCRQHTNLCGVLKPRRKADKLLPYPAMFHSLPRMDGGHEAVPVPNAMIGQFPYSRFDPRG